jgi:hypothetical protein
MHQYKKPFTVIKLSVGIEAKNNLFDIGKAKRIEQTISIRFSIFPKSIFP